MIAARRSGHRRFVSTWTRVGFVGDATVRVARAESLGQTREVIVYVADAATTREVDSSEDRTIGDPTAEGAKISHAGAPSTMTYQQEGGHVVDWMSDGGSCRNPLRPPPAV